MKTCQHCNPIGRKSHKKLYEMWTNIKQRTRNPKCRNYKDYGGRGIDICDLWADSFADFVLDVITLPKNGNTLDRIDNSKGYVLGNVRWANMMVQNRNRRSNRLITFNGETKTLIEWAASTGISASTLVYRLGKLGWPIDKALTQSLRNDKRRGEHDVWFEEMAA